MGVSVVTAWDAATAQRYLRRSKRRSLILRLIGIAIALSILGDHLRPANRHGDDWSRFDGTRLTFAQAIDGESLVLTGDATAMPTRVHPWGVASFNPHWDAEACRRCSALLAGRSVYLRLEPAQTRDEQNRLLAYVYLDDQNLLSVRLVAEGLVLADRRWPYALHGAVDAAEREARKKQLGLWATATDSMMPPWRQQWARQRRQQSAD